MSSQKLTGHQIKQLIFQIRYGTVLHQFSLPRSGRWSLLICDRFNFAISWPSSLYVLHMQTHPYCSKVIETWIAGLIRMNGKHYLWRRCASGLSYRRHAVIESRISVTRSATSGCLVASESLLVGIWYYTIFRTGNKLSRLALSSH